MIDDATISRAVEMLRQAAPEATIILVGSYARGEANDDSDLDFLVIEPKVEARRHESVRLRDVLRPLRIPVDILVTSEQTFAKWAGTPGTVLYEAAREGRVFNYDELPPEPEDAFDRAWALDCVRRTREWAEPLIRAREAD